MPDDIRWIRSYVLAEHERWLGTICIYQASSPEAIRTPRRPRRPSGRRDRRGRRHRDRAARPGRNCDLRRGERHEHATLTLGWRAAARVAMIVALAASAAPPAPQPASCAAGTLAGGAGSGSTVGPDGALYVPEPAAARSGASIRQREKTLFASALPRRFTRSRLAARWTSRSSATPRTHS